MSLQDVITKIAGSGLPLQGKLDAFKAEFEAAHVLGFPILSDRGTCCHRPALDACNRPALTIAQPLR